MAKIEISVNPISGGSIRITLNDHVRGAGDIKEMQIKRAAEITRVKNELAKIFSFKVEDRSKATAGDNIFVTYDIKGFIKSEFKNEKPIVSEVAYIAKQIATKCGYDFAYRDKLELTERLK